MRSMHVAETKAKYFSHDLKQSDYCNQRKSHWQRFPSNIYAKEIIKTLLNPYVVYLVPPYQ